MTDRRILKTKRTIKRAFVSLLSEKDINHITIKDIADRADINRKTFYSYYRGIYQLVDEIENEIVSDFNEAVESFDFSTMIQSPNPVFEKLTSIINNDIELYGAILSTKHNSGIFEKIVEILKLNIKHSIQSQINIEDDKLDIIMNYSVSGMIAVYRSWFNSGSKQSIEEISRMVSILCTSGVQPLLSEYMQR